MCPYPTLSTHQDFQQFKEAVVRYEREMLRMFGFITHVEHPHKLVLNYCQLLRVDTAHPDLVREAWALLNDSLRTTLCVRFRPHVVACGIIFLAGRRLQVRRGSGAHEQLARSCRAHELWGW